MESYKKRVLLDMEIGLSMIAHQKKKVDYMIRSGIPLSNPNLVHANQKMEKYLEHLMEHKCIFENTTGERVFFIVNGINAPDAI